MRILVIEDDYILGAAIRDHVMADGHSADWMQRLDDARAALDTVSYELILLDLNLPDGRGLELLREVRAANNPVPVIITTAQDQILVRIGGLNAGADDYLVKPFDLSEMSARISAWRAAMPALPGRRSSSKKPRSIWRPRVSQCAARR